MAQRLQLFIRTRYIMQRKAAKLVPYFLKPAFSPVIRILGNLENVVIRRKGRDALHEYWKHPWDGVNLPQDYRWGEERSQYLVELVQRYVDSSSSIAEVGCNVGRNLYYLFLAGFKKLGGVEISQDAVQLLNKFYPEMASHAKIVNKPAEEGLREFEDNEFDVVFTMAVLQHIHPDSDFVFYEMARMTRQFLITIEIEQGPGNWRVFPRDYRGIFESLGFEQVEEANCSEIVGLGDSYLCRVFKKVVDKV